MNEVKITIPDNCELVKAGNTYIIKERNFKPKSWKEFCENFPINPEECFIDTDSDVLEYFSLDNERREIEDRVLCINKKEAEAFLALMQLRQLRKAWVGDWEPSYPQEYAVIILYEADKLEDHFGMWEFKYSMSFPTKEMAKDFLNCFRDLCETAKCLL